MKKTLLFVTLISVLACTNKSISPENNKFDFSGYKFGTGSFYVLQQTNDAKTELTISIIDASTLNLTKSKKVFDYSKFKVQILEYQNPLKDAFTEFNLMLLGKGRDKTNTLTNTWVANSGIIEIYLTEGVPIAGNSCRSKYTVNLVLKDFSFSSSKTKESFTLKSHSFENIEVGWCME